MKRRSFLQLLGLAAAPAVASVSPPAPALNYTGTTTGRWYYEADYQSGPRHYAKRKTAAQRIDELRRENHPWGENRWLEIDGLRGTPGDPLTQRLGPYVTVGLNGRSYYLPTHAPVCISGAVAEVLHRGTYRLRYLNPDEVAAIQLRDLKISLAGPA